MKNVEFISAGAGSGKTYRLTTTLADALESGAARPHAVLATTFTVKAATELRERARSWLLKNGRVGLASAIGQAKLGTVNSVCGQLLTRFCFELGLSPDQTVLSETQASRLLRASLAESLEGAGQAELTRLTARFGIEHDEWSRALEDIVKAALNNDITPERLRAMGAENADLMLEHWPAPRLDVDLNVMLKEALANASQEVSRRIAETRAAGGKVTDVISKGGRELDRLLNLFKEGRWTWLDWLAATGVGAGATVKAVVERVAEVAKNHEAHPQFHADVRRYLDLVFGLSADALDTYAHAKRTLGAVDFSDQEVLLLRAVRENASVRAALAAELDLVMVDEFQDTSPLQLALFVELSKLAKRSVWVGDPKQAIYGFRGTDARLISGILGSIEALGGTLGEPLTTSRRSTPSLVSLTNAVFADKFLPELQPADVALQAHRTDLPQAALLSWSFESSKVETDYEALGTAVRQLLASGMSVCDKATNQVRPVEARDIAVLCRRHTEVELAVSSLTRWGVACASPRAGLLGTPEALFVLACLRRLQDADDTVATALILTLADGVPAEQWLADRLDFLAQPDADSRKWKVEGEAAHPLLARLEALRPQLNALTPREALRLAKAQSQVAKVCSRWSKSPQEAEARIANVEAVMDLAVGYEDECLASKRPATVGGLLRWLAEQADEQADDRATSSGNAVTVLTHHAAKGLEWPVVILTSLGTPAKTSLWGVRARTNGGFNPQAPLDNRFVHFWLKTWGKRKQPQAAANAEGSPIGETMKADALAEHRRLLYVSMTRARDVNVVVSCQRPTKALQDWVLEVEAGPLLFGPSGPLELPDGRFLVRQSQAFSAANAQLQPPAGEVATCCWYLGEPAQEAGPLWVRPSDAAGGEYRIAQSLDLGERVQITSAVDMAQLGSAVHLCLARAGVAGRVDEEEVRHILKTWRVTHAVSEAAVAAQVQRFFAFVNERWPGCPVHVESPIEADRPDGSRVRGFIDLLVDTPAGWVLVDHKANPGGSSRNESLVSEHGPQLAEYASAVHKATGKPVTEQWLYMPVAGRAVCIEAIA